VKSLQRLTPCLLNPILLLHGRLSGRFLIA